MLRGVENLMRTYVVLLRGVMPYGRNKVPMAALRTILTEAGLRDVQTYIQSGNVIAKSELKRAEIETLVHDAIRENRRSYFCHSQDCRAIQSDF